MPNQSNSYLNFYGKHAVDVLNILVVCGKYYYYVIIIMLKILHDKRAEATLKVK